MFGQEMSASLADLTPQQRSMLLDLGELRYKKLSQMLSLIGLRNIALTDPSPENIKQYQDFEALVDDLMSEVMEKQREALLAGIDIDKLKALLPSLVAGLLQAVDLPYLMILLDVNASLLEKVIEHVQAFLRDGLG